MPCHKRLNPAPNINKTLNPVAFALSQNKNIYFFLLLVSPRNEFPLSSVNSVSPGLLNVLSTSIMSQSPVMNCPVDGGNEEEDELEGGEEVEEAHPHTPPPKNKETPLSQVVHGELTLGALHFHVPTIAVVRPLTFGHFREESVHWVGPGVRLVQGMFLFKKKLKI
jgi:hypothetical protein